MEFYEMTVTLLLHENLLFTESNEKIGNLISAAMHLDAGMAEKHRQKGYKFYTFNNLYPIEADKRYKAGRAYVFTLRSLDWTFINKLKLLLNKVNSSEFKILSAAVKTQKMRFIEKMTTLTPAVITVDNRNWVGGDDVLLLINRLHANLEKKYRNFYGEELDTIQNFIQRIELLNQKPVVHKYKDTKMFGNKLRITVNDDEMSQKLAFVGLACGIGEKNSSAGMGFCMEGR
ncbi:MAG: CRISPR-associated endoribonuclease Cas6 [Clostridiaceae bacterium]|nr:CRISPR-associated endoribonuclease Cas6 [Clostridiaceae bacterium]